MEESQTRVRFPRGVGDAGCGTYKMGHSVERWIVIAPRVDFGKFQLADVDRVIRAFRLRFAACGIVRNIFKYFQEIKNSVFVEQNYQERISDPFLDQF